MRKHIHQIELAAPPEVVFKLLITPSAIRRWWGASRAIVLPKVGGVWAAAWGDEDIPDFVSVFKIAAIEKPKRLFLTETKYFAKNGPLPFKSEMTTEFIVEPAGGGSILQVAQEGFPDDPVADEFYAACGKGWQETFAEIEKYLANH